MPYQLNPYPRMNMPAPEPIDPAGTIGDLMRMQVAEAQFDDFKQQRKDQQAARERSGRLQSILSRAGGNGYRAADMAGQAGFFQEAQELRTQANEGAQAEIQTQRDRFSLAREGMETGTQLLQPMYDTEDDETLMNRWDTNGGRQTFLETMGPALGQYGATVPDRNAPAAEVREWIDMAYPKGLSLVEDMKRRDASYERFGKVLERSTDQSEVNQAFMEEFIRIRPDTEQERLMMAEQARGMNVSDQYVQMIETEPIDTLGELFKVEREGYNPASPAGMLDAYARENGYASADEVPYAERRRVLHPPKAGNGKPPDTGRKDYKSVLNELRSAQRGLDRLLSDEMSNFTLDPAEVQARRDDMLKDAFRKGDAPFPNSPMYLGVQTFLQEQGKESAPEDVLRFFMDPVNRKKLKLDEVSP